MLSENVGRRKLSYHSVNKIKGFPASSPCEVICLKLIMNALLLTEKGTTAIAAELLPWFLEHSVFMGNLHTHTELYPGLAVYYIMATLSFRLSFNI